MSEKVIECGLIKVITIKILESANSALCDMCGTILSSFINVLKIKKEETVERKKKIIISNIIDACIV